MENIIIDGFNYTIKPIKFDLSKLDYDGRFKDYCDKTYVLKDIETNEYIVRSIHHFDDDNNTRNAFDPYNYHKDSVFLVLSHGDDNWDLDNVFEILSTDNTSGIINSEWGVTETFQDLITKSKINL